MLRRAGLALSLGALAAYGLRNAMADHPGGVGGGRRHLDASGPREVMYCHQCDHEWYQDEHGLRCPNCEGEITEIVTPESDPRPGRASPDSIPDLEDLHPWPDIDSDPEEADIEEHITRGPGGSVFITQSFRSHGSGGQRHGAPGSQSEPDRVIQDFQSMLGNLMGPNLRMGQVGRSGPNAIFPPSPFGDANVRAGGFRVGGNSPAVGGARFTFATGRLRPRDADGPQPGGPPVDDLATYDPPSPNGRSLHIISIAARPDQLASILGSLFGHMGPPPGHAEDGPLDGPRGMPMGLQGLFAQLLNPQNAVHGDAVYSQEALDRIISNLMEQHPTSNAPGPASASSIASLPKKKLDEKMLGPELKGECSVCMDDVHVGDEVVCLPCTHWFHEVCASAWLSEHNTCPICRKGIDGDSTPAAASRRSSNGGSASRNEHRSRRMSIPRRLSRNDRESRNEARLDAIRDRGRLSPTNEDAPPSRRQEGPWRNGSATPPDIPSGSMSSLRRRESEMSEGQRDSRRANTSGSDQSRRSSQSGNGGSSGGPMDWIRDRFSSSRRND